MKHHLEIPACVGWITILVCLFVPVTASGFTPTDIKIAWDANNEDDLAGYKLYYKIGSPIVDKEDPGVNVVDVPNSSLAKPDEPEITIEGLDERQVYFFAVTAYDDAEPANESDLSTGACTLRITEPEPAFFANSSNYTHYKIKGKGVPDVLIEVFANNNISLGTVTVDIDGVWTTHVDFTLVSEGVIELTVETGGIRSFPVEGILDITAPVIESIPSVPDKKDTYAIIEWMTDEPAIGSVEYGLDANYGTIKTSEVFTQNHRVIISGLNAETVYHFRVNAVDAAGNGPDTSAGDNNPSPDYNLSTDPPTPPSIVKFPAIEFDYLIITFDKPDMQNADLETSYAFDPSLIFYTTDEISDDIFTVSDFSYLLFIRYIPAHEVIRLTVSNITDSAGQPVTPPTITINDNDQDEMADDWEVEYGFNPQINDGHLDPDGDEYTNLNEYLARTHPRSAASAPFRIVDTIPQNNARISNSKRVPNDSSAAFLIASNHGINTTAEDSISFTIDDGVHAAYERNLHSDTVRVVKLSEDDDTQVTLLWVVYDRSLETFISEQVFPFDAVVNIAVDARDVNNNTMNTANLVFKVESDELHLAAQNDLPSTANFNPGEPEYDAGIEVTDGDLEGAMIFYDSSEPMTPSFGSSSVIQPPAVVNGDAAIGVPANLIPHTVFDKPVKIFIPGPGVSDVSNLRLYYFNGMEWQLACDANGNVLSGGEGWMVPGSRVNHNDTSPPMIELKVHHFSAAQAVASVNSTPGGPSAGTAATSSSGGGGCFIGSVKSSNSVDWISCLSLLILLSSLAWLISVRGLIAYSRFTRSPKVNKP